MKKVISSVPESLSRFVRERIVESNGGWMDKKAGAPESDALMAFIEWVYARPNDVSPRRYYEQKAAEFSRHPAYRREWAPLPRRALTRS